MNKDKQFYRKIIRDSKRILPYVNDWRWLCLLYECSETLASIISRVADLHHVNDLQYSTFSLRTHKDFYDYRNTEEWKSDRIFLLNEIIRYCEYKLNQLK